MRSTDLEHGHAEHAMHISHGMPLKTAAAHMGHDRHAGSVNVWHKPGESSKKVEKVKFQFHPTPLVDLAR